MRWILIDRILEINKGRYARALKNVSLGEDYLQEHFPGFPLMPNSLIIEALAQTGGILVGHLHNFKYKVVLAKIEKAEFLKPVRPGDQLILEAKIIEEREEGCRVEGKGKVNAAEVARVKLMFITLTNENGSWPKENFIFNPNFLSLLELDRIEIPSRPLPSEERAE